MKKRVVVYCAEGDGSRDRGEKVYSLTMDNSARRLQLESGFTVVKAFDLDDISSVDCYRSANPNGNDAMNGAAIGLLVAGPVGAAVGGLLGSQNKLSWFLEINQSSGSETFRFADEQNKDKFVKWAEKNGVPFK